MVIFPVLWLLLATCFATSDEAPVSPFSPELNAETFDALKGTYFIKFYSPYCPHCVKLAPLWDSAAEEISKLDPSGKLKFAAVNCVENGDLCNKAEIKAYPSLRVYRDAKEVYQYKHKGSTERNLLAFAKNYLYLGDDAFEPQYEEEGSELLNSPNVRISKDIELLSDLQLDETLERPRIIIFSELNGTDFDGLRSAFQEYSTDDIDVAQVICASGDEFCKNEGVTQFPTVKVYDLDNNVFSHAGDLAEQRLVKFFTFCLGAPKPGRKSKKPKGATKPNANKGADADAKRAKAVANAKAKAQHRNGEDNDDEELDSSNEHAASDDSMGSESAENAAEFQEGAAKLEKQLSDSENEGKEAEPAASDDVKVEESERPNLEVSGLPTQFQQQQTALSHADGTVHALDSAAFNSLVKQGSEPWLIKFYSPTCPHCVNMAQEYINTAKLGTGTINVGEVNCKENPELCNAEDVPYYPYVTVYQGAYKSKVFDGNRRARIMYEYALSVSQVQITSVVSEDELLKHIITNFDQGLSSFLYIYDATVSTEDWDALAEMSMVLNDYNCRILATNSKTVRAAAGVSSGPSFMRVTFTGTNSADSVKYEIYPLSQFSRTAMTPENIEKWSFREKWLGLQPLRPEEQTLYTEYVAVAVLPDLHKLSQQPQVLELNNLAESMRSQSALQQANFLMNLREELAKQNVATTDDELFKTLFDNDFAQRISFAYVAESDFKELYLPHFKDSEAQSVGSSNRFIMMDFYNSLYVSTLDEKPLSMSFSGIDSAISLLDDYKNKGVKSNSVVKLKSKFKSIPKPLTLNSVRSYSLKRFLLFLFTAIGIYSVVYRPCRTRRIHSRARRVSPV